MTGRGLAGVALYVGGSWGCLASVAAALAGHAGRPLALFLALSLTLTWSGTYLLWGPRN